VVFLENKTYLQSRN